MAFPELGKLTLTIAEDSPQKAIAHRRDEGANGPQMTQSPDPVETFSCTGDPGPDRMDCPAAIGIWSTLVDDEGNLHIDSGRCRSITVECCSTIVCAPLEDISILPEEVTGRMWLPLTMKCISGGRGGQWQNDQGTIVVKMERPTSAQCSA